MDFGNKGLSPEVQRQRFRPQKSCHLILAFYTYMDSFSDFKCESSFKNVCIHTEKSLTCLKLEFVFESFVILEALWQFWFSQVADE